MNTFYKECVALEDHASSSLDDDGSFSETRHFYPHFNVSWRTGLYAARRTNTAKRAPNMPMHHGHVSIPVCTISILWNFHTNPYHPSKNYELKQQGDGDSETSRTTNYELHGTGWATRAPVAQTLQTVRQTCSCTTAT